MRINEEKEIEINRGDRGTIKVTCSNGNFQVGEKIKFSVVEKNDYSNVVLQKEFPILEESNVMYITLTKEDTTIGEVINRKKEYWYEIEYSGDLTLVGHDSNGAKKFILYPEAQAKGSE